MPAVGSSLGPLVSCLFAAVMTRSIGGAAGDFVGVHRPGGRSRQIQHQGISGGAGLWCSGAGGQNRAHVRSAEALPIVPCRHATG
jgi:hypothetical protein